MVRTRKNGKHLHIKIDEYDHNRLKVLAAQSGLSISDYARPAIIAVLDQQIRERGLQPLFPPPE